LAAEKLATEEKRLAAEKRAAEKLAAEKLAEEKRLAAEKRAAEKRATEKQPLEKQAVEKLAAEKQATERLATEKQAAEKRASEKQAAKQAAAKRATDKRAEKRGAETQITSRSKRLDLESLTADNRVSGKDASTDQRGEISNPDLKEKKKLSNDSKSDSIYDSKLSSSDEELGDHQPEPEPAPRKNETKKKVDPADKRIPSKQIQVLLDFGDAPVEIDETTHYTLQGLETAHPLLQIGHEVFEGTYQDILGTYVVFRKNDEDSGYLCHTTKVLKFTRVILDPK